MKMDQLTAIFNEIAPIHMAEDWDNVGLLVGNSTANVRKALICIDLTEAVLEEAIAVKANLIVAYHPPIFKALKTVTDDETKSRIVLRAIEKKIAIYSPHTALDAAENGVNDWLTEPFGKGTVVPIEPAVTPTSKQYKLVTFVPMDKMDMLRVALSVAGAGVIGNYEQCSFVTEGTGTFLGNKASNPTVGKAGKLEYAPEAKLEMIVPATPGNCLPDVITALRQTHPYEEPAFDIIPLHAEPVTVKQGMGRIITLQKSLSLQTCIARLKKHLGVKTLEICKVPGDDQPSIRRIGVCAGAGGSFLGSLKNVDLYITGEMRHHDMLAAVDRGIHLLLAGHTQTERPFLPRLRDMLIERGARSINWQISTADQAPNVFG
ncbi:MAG: Nif3-like dinuclear metal center hexameric protein [Phycisphaeraceae bacterium]|nr:Nif3-like dinuclear metal center hexameric protein [Phycisphaeraceae bacterium]